MKDNQFRQLELRIRNRGISLPHSGEDLITNILTQEKNLLQAYNDLCDKSDLQDKLVAHVALINLLSPDSYPHLDADVVKFVQKREEFGPMQKRQKIPAVTDEEKSESEEHAARKQIVFEYLYQLVDKTPMQAERITTLVQCTRVVGIVNPIDEWKKFLRENQSETETDERFSA